MEKVKFVFCAGFVDWFTLREDLLDDCNSHIFFLLFFFFQSMFITD